MRKKVKIKNRCKDRRTYWPVMAASLRSENIEASAIPIRLLLPVRILPFWVIRDKITEPSTVPAAARLYKRLNVFRRKVHIAGNSLFIGIIRDFFSNTFVPPLAHPEKDDGENRAYNP